MQSQLIPALRYFRLVENDGTPTERLARLTSGTDVEMQRTFGAYVKDSYAFLFSGSINLQNATQ